MINGNKYFEDVKVLFSFLNLEFGFILTKEIENGNAFYDVEYRNNYRAISISYENVEDYLQVIVFILKDGKLPDYDDKTRSLHLHALNKSLLPKIHRNEIEANISKFNGFIVTNDVQKKLLKSARELRLVLKNWSVLGYDELR